jgi:hypothetical protein
MTTYIDVLRTNRTIGHKKIKDKADGFKFEGGYYYVLKDKVFLATKKTLFGKKIIPKLLYMEGVSLPLYLDNFKIKEYEEDMPVLDEKTHTPIYEDVPVMVYDTTDHKFKQKLDEKGKPVTEKKIKTKKVKVKKLEDIFIDARAIHNMTNDKILADLSAEPTVKNTELLIIFLIIVGCILSIITIIRVG